LGSSKPACPRAEMADLLAVGALSAHEISEAEAHIASCAECQRELAAARGVIDSWVSWPTDLLRPHPSLWQRLATRLAGDTGPPMPPGYGIRSDAEWEEAAPGICCKLLATDTERGLVSMLVRLAPGVEYPPHMHADFEELHLLDGELWIGDRKLLPGDFRRAESGTSDKLVWSETGCTCFLTTSFQDALTLPAAR